MGRDITLALVQADVIVADKRNNISKGCDLIEQAAKRGAQVVLLPELFTTGYNPKLLADRYYELSETAQGETVQEFSAAARKNNVYVYFGFAENRGVSGVVYNSSAFIGPDGKLLRVYAKSHLFAVERLYFSKGNSIEIVQTELGPLGLSICYDVGFPEMGRILALGGAEVMLCLSAWYYEDRDIWINNAIARATDNLFFVANCNRVGNESGLHLIGQSLIAAPRGHIIAEAPMDQEAILVHAIDLDDVVRARRNCLYFIDRRTDLYARYGERAL